MDGAIIYLVHEKAKIVVDGVRSMATCRKGSFSIVFRGTAVVLLLAEEICSQTLKMRSSSRRAVINEGWFRPGVEERIGIQLRK
jgi:hypothetical protein